VESLSLGRTYLATLTILAIIFIKWLIPSFRVCFFDLIVLYRLNLVRNDTDYINFIDDLTLRVYRDMSNDAGKPFNPENYKPSEYLTGLSDLI
jgi:hypothetical protein